MENSGSGAHNYLQILFGNQRTSQRSNRKHRMEQPEGNRKTGYQPEAQSEHELNRWLNSTAKLKSNAATLQDESHRELSGR